MLLQKKHIFRTLLLSLLKLKEEALFQKKTPPSRLDCFVVSYQITLFFHPKKWMRKNIQVKLVLTWEKTKVILNCIV